MNSIRGGGEARPHARRYGRGTQGEHAYQYVKQEILRGRFKPSELLPINTLAAEAEVSRQPIFDAVRRLSSEQLVDVIPQVGCRVAVHNFQQMADFFILFAAVEGLLARLAAERHVVEDFRKLRRISSEIGQLRDPDVDMPARSEGYRALNHEFHRIIHEMARAPEIASLCESFWDRVDFYLTTSSGVRHFAERLFIAHDEHESLIDILEARDGATAAMAMSEHIMGFRDSLLSSLERQNV